MKAFSAINHSLRSVGAVALFAVLFMQVSCRHPTPATLEQALMAGDWQAIEQLASADTLLQEPSTVGVLGHAALMRNRNVHSYLLMLALREEEHLLRGWLIWSQSLATRHPRAANGRTNPPFYPRTGNLAQPVCC